MPNIYSNMELAILEIFNSRETSLSMKYVFCFNRTMFLLVKDDRKEIDGIIEVVAVN